MSIKEIGVALGIIAAIVGFSYWDSSDERKFSRFLKNASKEELLKEREKVRLDFCDPALNNYQHLACESKLRRFDDEIRTRSWDGKEYSGPGFHREHGWYLENDD